MGHGPVKDEEFVVDLENGTRRTRENESLDDQLIMSVDDSLVSLSIGPLDDVLKAVIDSKEVVDFTVVKKIGKEKRKKAASSAKKPPKPPRPPRGFSLDAADQKLIKELAELAMMKRARIERMKALQAKKALKASSSSSSSSMNAGSLFAMLFTVIFVLMMLLQGMSCRSPGVTSIGSPQTAQTNENGLVFIQEQLNPSASDSILPHTRSSNLFEKISGSASSASRKVL